MNYLRRTEAKSVEKTSPCVVRVHFVRAAVLASVLPLLTIPVVAASPVVDVTSLCLRSVEPAKIGLQMKIYTDVDAGIAFAFIRYSAAKPWIPLARGDRKATPYGEGTPDDVVTTWLEVSGNTISGRYVMDSQAATVNSFVYTNSRTNKKFEFELIGPADAGDQCPALK